MNTWIILGVVWFLVFYFYTGYSLKKIEKALSENDKEVLKLFRKPLLKYAILSYALIVGLMLFRSQAIWLGIPAIGISFILLINYRMYSSENIAKPFIEQYQKSSLFYVVGLLGLGGFWGYPLTFHI